jgi:hypothetical protein
MSFAKLMSSTGGRILRIVAGLALIGIGFGLVGGTAGIFIAVIGVVPLLAGLLDVCVIGRLLLGTPLKGSEVRVKAGE